MCECLEYADGGEYVCVVCRDIREEQLKEDSARIAELEAVLAMVKRVVHDNNYIETYERDQLNAILASQPKVLAVVEGHYRDEAWWTDVVGDMTLELLKEPYMGTVPATVIIIEEKK